MPWSGWASPASRALIATSSHGQQGAERAAQWLDDAQASLELYAGHPAVAFADLAAEVATEVRLLRAIQAELAVHAPNAEALPRRRPRRAGPQPPGLADIGGPALVACMGDPLRFPTGKAFRSFTGLVPKASRPATPTARARPCPRPDRRCCAPRWSEAPTTPGGSTRSWRGSTTSRWSSGAKTTSARWGGRPPRRARLGGAAPGNPLRRLRHRGEPGGSPGGQGHHRRALRGHPRTARPETQQEVGEGPPKSSRRTVPATGTSRAHGATSGRASSRQSTRSSSRRSNG